MKWKIIKNTQTSIFFQHRNLAHHVITAHYGSPRTWWMPQHVNLSYTVTAGGMHKFMIRDMILSDRNAVFEVVQTIGMIGNCHSQATLETDIRNSHPDVISVGESEYRQKYPANDQQERKNVISPVDTKKNNDDFGFLMAQVIRQMMNEK